MSLRLKKVTTPRTVFVAAADTGEAGRAAEARIHGTQDMRSSTVIPAEERDPGPSCTMYGLELVTSVLMMRST